MAGLATLEPRSVQCVITSPPYWGLRDYGIAGQFGLEATPQEYVERMVGVFAAVRRVLRTDGTLWLNLGDCYATGAGRVGDHPGGGEQGARWKGEAGRVRDSRRRDRAPVIPTGSRNGHEGKHGAVGPITQPNRMPIAGLKPKDLIGMPWRVAFALQADGWWLRSDIVWSKPNPMPESVTDRPTRSHEYLFLMSRARRYFYNADAIREPFETDPRERYPERATVTGRGDQGYNGTGARAGDRDKSGGFPPRVKTVADPNVRGRRQAPEPGEPGAFHALGRNRRSVWTIATCPFPGAHFATFPVALVEPCILAGTRPGDTVLDPFAGAGTALLVADRLGRNGIGIELNPEYAALATRRTVDDAPLFHQHHRTGEGE